MNKFCFELFKCEQNWLRKLIHNFVVHSNESECRKSGRLGMEQVNWYLVNTNISFPRKSYVMNFYG